MDNYQTKEHSRVPDMGNHLILDFNDVNPEVDLNNVDELDTKIREIVAATSVEVVG